MLLMLDFDRVLHPEHNGEPTPADQAFCHLPRFESVMRDFPQVLIVITSMWRYQFTLEELKAHFSPDIAARIIGMTQVDVREDGKYLPARRESEIVDWLLANGRSDEEWVALDDAVWQFINYRENLVSCQWHVGFDDATAKRLRQVLKGRTNDLVP